LSLGSNLAFAELPFSFSALEQVPVPRDGNCPLLSTPAGFSDAVEAYKSVRTRLMKAQATKGFRSVVVSSVGRAEGKTLTAFNLAYCCASVSKFGVLLIDSDMRNRSLTKLMGLMPRLGLADLMMERASFEEAIVRTDVPNLYVMGAGNAESAATELFLTQRWKEILEWSRQHFNLTLVDSLPTGEFTDFELVAPECDGILLVVKPRSTPQDALKATLAQLDPEKIVGIVCNGAE
jgi:capsular exopolysaccharide synthesis family protein